jgi:TonB family protein
VRVFGVVTGVIAALLVTGNALAQPADISPPAPLGDTSVAYPKGASGDARVIVELVVDAEGNVKSVRVIEGEQPFAVAAARAARAWRFSPATSAGVAREARIRFEVLFSEPPPSESQPLPPRQQATDDKTPAAQAAKPQAADAPIVVDVLGEKQEPAVISLQRAEVRQLPGAFGDPFRAIEAMPGVTPILSGVPFFFVRGAPPGNVGYFLDGIRVPLLYHLALGPSVVHPAIVERVDLYAGGYPARHGRFAGGIVAGETTAPEPEFHGEANIRLLDTGVLVEAPFAARRGTAAVGGRYSYTALVLSLIAPEVELQYWDYQARVSYALGDNDSVTLFGFGAFDYLAEEQEDGSTRTIFGTEFHRLDLRYDHQPSRRTRARTALTVGVDRTRAEEDFSVVDRMLAVRSELNHRVSRQALWRGGVDTVMDVYTVELPPLAVAPEGSEFDGSTEEDFARRFFPGRTDLVSGVWTDVVLDPEPGVTVTPGLRLDYYSSQGATALGVDPRISARFAVSERVRLLHALGIAHQPPSFIVTVPGLQIGGLPGGLQRSLQASSGVEIDLPEDVTATFTVFDNVFLNMSDVLGTIRDGSEDDEIDAFRRRALGSTVGIEVYVRRPLTRRLGGFLSYTLSRSTRSFRREKFPAAFDRTHVLNLALAYDLGKRWRAGSRFVFYTGFPNQDRGISFDGAPIADEPDRIPAFWRLDLRLEKRWRLGERGYWALVFEALNATLNRETIDLDCRPDGCEPEEIGPVTVPSIGVEAVF